MLGIDLTVKIDAPFGAIDPAFIERVVHEALSEARIPVVDVEFDNFRDVDAPLSEQLGGPSLQEQLAPYTRPPGAQG